MQLPTLYQLAGSALARYSLRRRRRGALRAWTSTSTTACTCATPTWTTSRTACTPATRTPTGQIEHLLARNLETLGGLQQLYARGEVISKIETKVAEKKTGVKACKREWEQSKGSKYKRCKKCGKME